MVKPFFLCEDAILPEGIVIRDAQLSDTPALVDYLMAIFSEPGLHLTTPPGEYRITLEEEQAYIQSHLASQNSVLLIAEVEGRVSGMLRCDGGSRWATRHTTSLGMTVGRDFRNKGIGKLLIQAAIAWAKSTGVVRRIELSVYANNPRAIHLYEKMGFSIEGRRRESYRYEGQYVDDYVMGLLL